MKNYKNKIWIYHGRLIANIENFYPIIIWKKRV
jgi:hypothetical protein